MVDSLAGLEGWPTPTPAVSETPTVKDPRVVPILYAPNRTCETTGKFPQFSAERSPTLTFGSALVRIPENHVFGQVERPVERTYWFFVKVREKEKQTDHFTLPDVRLLSREEFLESIRACQL